MGTKQIRSIVLVGAIAVACSANTASAWTRAGHMVTAAIAYDELAQTDRPAIDAILSVMQNHPDKGSFEVAVARATGEERGKRIFVEMARWSDDIRGGMYDHPTWHYAFKPLVRSAHVTNAEPTGDAFEAFALNLKEAANENAPPADRAVALCWIFHIVGDIHQPLHSAQLFSDRFPKGDHGGGLQFVRDPQTGAPEALHWFWDDSVNRDDDPDAAFRRAGEIEHAYSRATFSDLVSSAPWPRQFQRWGGEESYALAVSLAYRPGLETGDTPETAKPLPPDYVAAATRTAQKRAAEAGYRLAEILRSLFPPH